MPAFRPGGRPDGAQPWLAIGMLLIATVLLMATVVIDAAHSFGRYLIVALWVVTSVAAMMKERLAYGLGDRVTLFGAVLILAVSIAAAMLQPAHGNALRALSYGSIGIAGFMALRTLVNVLHRLRQVAPEDAGAAQISARPAVAARSRRGSD